MKKVEMFKVQSLKRIIVAQFAVILVPLACLLVYQSMVNARRNETLSGLFHGHELALKARDQYTVFVNGAADAVDTQRLSAPVLAALARSGELMRQLGRDTAAETLIASADDIAAMVAALTARPDLPTLQTLQARVNANRMAILRTQARYDEQMDAAISRSIEDTLRETRVVSVFSLLLLALTVWFIARMIRDLSEPLNFAVSVADRIAEGRDVDEQEFRHRRDIGNLLHSLAGMQHNLKNYRVEVEAARRSLEEQMGRVLESQNSLAEAQRLAQLGNWHWEPQQRSGHWSDEMYRILGAVPGACQPGLATVLALVDAAHRHLLKDRLAGLLRGAGPFSDEIHLRGVDGRPRIVHHHASSQKNAAGEVVRLCGTLQDITTRRQAEAEIRRLAHYDSLTGLSNRRFFLDHLEREVARAKRTGRQLAVLFLDLDRFKRINDTLGHAAGDSLLKEAANRLRECVRDTDYVARDLPGADTDAAEDGHDAAQGLNTVARLGGDEFTATLVDLKHAHDAAKVAQRILHALSQPFLIEGSEIFVTASVGIAVHPMDGDSADQLMKNADTAMYRAKEMGKDMYQFFAKDMNTAAFAKIMLESELRKAMERDQFVLHYQPKVDAVTGRIKGVEALIRWAHPEWGLLAPGRFITLAEEAGLIVGIGNWVLESACRQLAQWRDAGFADISIAINLASPSFKQKDLVTRVRAALRHHGVEPHLLQLEATESMMMSDVESTMQTLGELRQIGVQLSIDDFGTGYSSLSYLRRFPIDQLKIDRSFVADMTKNADDAAIVAVIVSLGRTLGLEVVAEGVETLQQARLLREMECDVLQGYHFCRPLPADEVAALFGGHAFSFDRQASRPVPLGHEALPA